MNLFRPACGKLALLFFPVAVILLLLASSRVMAEPWPIKHFEVVNVEPGGQSSTVLSMVFCGCNVTPAMRSIWSPSVANAEASVPAAGHVVWQKVPPCWLTKYCPMSPCANGLSFPKIRTA